MSWAPPAGPDPARRGVVASGPGPRQFTGLYSVSDYALAGSTSVTQMLSRLSLARYAQKACHEYPGMRYARPTGWRTFGRFRELGARRRLGLRRLPCRHGAFSGEGSATIRIILACRTPRTGAALFA